MAVVAVIVAVLLLAGCTKPDKPAAVSSAQPPSAAAGTPEQVRSIAEEAYVYGFPMVDNYRVMYSYFVDKDDSEYKGGWNEIHNTPRVYTPADTTIPTPNSDTPYSAVGADLRAEPLVLTVPPVDRVGAHGGGRVHLPLPSGQLPPVSAFWWDGGTWQEHQEQSAI